MKYFEYSKKDVNELVKLEPKFKEYINKIGEVKVKINPNVFESIVEAIIAQQISGKAASAITNRLYEKLKPLTPSGILSLSDEDFSYIGLGPQKRGYARSISQSFEEGIIKEEVLIKLNNEQLIEELVKLKGVGSWTAEMLLIFSLARRQVISLKDLGIKKGIAKLYDYSSHKEVSEEFLNKIKQKLSPQGTLASLYLWQIASLK